VKVVNFHSLETHAVSSTADHAYYLAFLHMWAEFVRSFQES
jgi:hypothetical protein